MRGIASGIGPQASGMVAADLLAFARELRTHLTNAEQLLWYLLRNRNLWGLKFRRQHPVDSYVLDFYCAELKFAIEVDGGQHGLEDEAHRDAQRASHLERLGIEIVRYWNGDVVNRTDEVVSDLLNKLAWRRLPLTPAPLPKGEGVEGMARL